MVEVTHRAREAETTKNHVQVAKDRAQRLVDVIAADKAVAEQKLEAARPALEEAEAALNTIKPAHIGETIIVVKSSISKMLFHSHGAETGSTTTTDYENYGRCFDFVSTENPTNLSRTFNGRL